MQHISTYKHIVLIKKKKRLRRAIVKNKRSLKLYNPITRFMWTSHMCEEHEAGRLGNTQLVDWERPSWSTGNLQAHAYIFTCTCIHTCTHICTYRQTHVHTHIHILTYMQTDRHVYIHIHLQRQFFWLKLFSNCRTHCRNHGLPQGELAEEELIPVRGRGGGQGEGAVHCHVDFLKHVFLTQLHT